MLKVTIIGHLGQDAQLKTFNNVNYVAFSVAHSEKFKKGDGTEVSKTQWVSCLKRIGDTDKLSQYLKKGVKVYVEGSLSAKVFTAGNGVPDVALNCNVSTLDITFKDAPTQTAGSGPQSTPTADFNTMYPNTDTPKTEGDDLPF